MKKYWALILSNRPHFYALGKHEDSDKALEFAESYCERKNVGGDQAEEHGPTYEVLYIMDESDRRVLTGEIHIPLNISQPPKPVVAVTEGVTPHGEETSTAE